MTDDRVSRQAVEPHIDERVHHLGNVAHGPGDSAAAVVALRRIFGGQSAYRPIEIGPRFLHQKDELVRYVALPELQYSGRLNRTCRASRT